MPRYRVTVFERKEYELKVQAANAVEAKRIALAEFDENRRWLSAEAEKSDTEIGVSEMELIEEE
jgi:hypothetical protein